jgi:septal ring factor EnvC (AmiA/AmiB activator)
MTPAQSQRIRRQIRENRKALDEARKYEANLRRQIQESERRSEQARRRLRRAGYL